MGRYLIHILIALDQVFTALLGGWPDESLSSYAYRLEANGRVCGRLFRPAIDAIFLTLFGQSEHCRLANESERYRRQFPPDLR